MIYYTYTETPIGRLLLAQQGENLTMATTGCPPAGSTEKTTPLLQDAAAQLQQYFAGQRKQFTLPLAPAGTPYQQKVWQALGQIPYGQTRTYGQLATAAGNPKAARAAGMGCNRNPLLIFIPCHRVVGATGALTGFAAGLGAKQQLLALEQAHR